MTFDDLSEGQLRGIVSHVASILQSTCRTADRRGDMTGRPNPTCSNKFSEDGKAWRSRGFACGWVKLAIELE